MKNTKTKLISSVTVLLICFAMLIGSTFAWFTDSASTGVNKIQAGTLDIELKMKNASGGWDDAEGQRLNWLAADGRAQDEIFWEPGATYKLPTLKITNNGNLALQFKVLINGVSGNLDLLDALEFSYAFYWMDENVHLIDSGTFEGSALKTTPYEIDFDETAIAEYMFGNDEDSSFVKGYLLTPEDAVPYPTHVGYYTLQAKMKETAGNTYQEMILENMSVTIVATQVPAFEQDSIGDMYDKDAKYPVVVNSQKAQDALMSNSTAGTSSGDVNIVAGTDINLNLDAVGGFYNATLGNRDSENVTIDAQGNKITFESDYRNAINCYGKLTISNAEIDSTYAIGGSTWDDYAIIFRNLDGGANEVVFNNVTFDRQVAIEKGVKATFNNCTINQTSSTGDMYALWIQAGADVTLNNCTINSNNPNAGSKNRAIKIADEYVTNPQLTKLTVNGTTFKSQKKAAVLVTSTAGANIVWGIGNDITAVQDDQTNAVWNDSDRAAAWDLVTVTGCTKYQEQ